MKKTIFIFFLLIRCAFAQTNVSGFINTNTNWTVAGSPYIVIGNALLSQGYTLTIDPGVVVKFNSQKALQIDGELIAIGTAASHITFTSNQPSPAPGDWAKLHFSSFSTPATYDTLGNYVSGSIMKYCDVLYAGDLDYGEVHIESTMPYLSHCTIQYSSHSGIYCAGSTFIIDSSLISNNSNYGLYFNQYTQNSCGLTVYADTLSNNAGGICLGGSSGSCLSEIKNCYFISNTSKGAINDSATYQNVNIHNNYFLNNISVYPNWGIVAFSGSVTLYLGINVEDNYFDSNHSNPNPTVFIYGNPLGRGSLIIIRRNNFSNNTSSSAIIGVNEGLMSDTISCNTFINNQTHSAAIHLSNPYILYGTSAAIQYNIFDGNSNAITNGVGILDVTQQAQSGVLDIKNNIIRNNSTATGKLFSIVAYLNDSIELLKIHHNQFENNVSNKIIFLKGPLINNSGLDFMYFKHNNFLDASDEYTLYDSIPYGSPNIKADSNYWGSTSTQHVDSIIYDYFDFAAQSVVYYAPILPDFNWVDTVCRIPCFVNANTVNIPSCYGYSNGSIELVTAGTSPYSYSWTPSGGNGPTASNLIPGWYTCTVTDSVVCVTSTRVYVNSPPYFGVTIYDSLNVTCYGGNNGRAYSDVYGGTSPYTYNWSPTGGTGLNAYNLTVGTYTITVTDAIGCIQTDTVTITQPTQINVTAVVLDDISCFSGYDGRAAAGATGGTPGYGYHWTPSGGNGNTATNLSAGTYTVTVTDSHVCFATSTVTLTQPPFLADTIHFNNASCSSCNDGFAYSDVSGGVPPYWYSWSPSGGTNATASNLAPGNYTCCITDANGCAKCLHGTVAYPTLIDEINSSSDVFTIIPNPAHNSFTVSLKGQLTIDNGQLEIYDVTGREVYSEAFHHFIQSEIRNHFSPGIYFVRVYDGKKEVTKKLVIE